MRYYCVFVLGLLWVVGVNGQTVWNKTYVEDRPVMLFSSVIKVGSVYHVIGVTAQAGSFYQYDRIFLGEIDETGLIVKQTVLFDSTTEDYSAYLNNLMLTASGKLLYTGHSDKPDRKTLLLQKDLNTDSVSIWEYSVPNASVYRGYCLLELDDYYYIAGVRTDSNINSADNFIMKVDTLGNKMWQKFYGASNRLEYPSSLIALSNGNLMMGTFRTDFNQTVEHANTWLLEVDTGGNLIRQWFDNSDSTYAAYGLRQTKDGGFIYGAQKKNYQYGFSSVSYNAIVVKMDSNFNKQWTIVRGGEDLSVYSGTSDIEELADGSIIVAGQITYYGTDTALNGWIMKVDAEGHMLWDRTYRGIDQSQSLNFLTDIDILEDGGIIATGQCQLLSVSPPQQGWILRLDSNGCEIENCILSLNPSPKERDLNSQIQVFPNPASNVVQVSLGDEFVGGTLKLYSTTGALVKQVVVEAPETIINVSTLPKGLYFITAEKDGVVVNTRLIVE